MRIISPADEIDFDLASNVLGVGFLCNAGSVVEVPDNKQLSFFRWEDELEAGAHARAEMVSFQLTANASSDAESDIYGVIGQVVNEGPGTTKAIYGRVTGVDSSTGDLVALVGAVRPAAATANAIGVQLAFDSTARKSDYGVWLTPQDGISASLDYGVLLADGLAIGQAGFAMHADGAGSLIRLVNGAGNAILFEVNSAGVISECKGATFNGAVNFNSPTAWAEQVAASFWNDERAWSFQAVNSGDKFRLIVGDVGEAFFVHADLTFNPQHHVNLESGKAYKVAGTQVVQGRETGYTQMTGTAAKSALATYGAGTASASYAQAELQSVMNALQALSRRVKAHEDSLFTHGLIGS